MYICVCQAVTESQIALAIQNGAQSVADLRQQLNVGSQCGLCLDCARNCLAISHTPAVHNLDIDNVTIPVLPDRTYLAVQA